jgi:hypothetical protein
VSSSFLDTDEDVARSSTGAEVTYIRRDTDGSQLFLAAPISFDGLLVQCAGRVVRPSPGKDTAEVHDYHDQAVPILATSLKRRTPGSRALGFTKV